MLLCDKFVKINVLVNLFLKKFLMQYQKFKEHFIYKIITLPIKTKNYLNRKHSNLKTSANVKKLKRCVVTMVVMAATSDE